MRLPRCCPRSRSRTHPNPYATSASPSSSTACVIPWTNLVVRPDGYAAFCCDVPGLLTVGDRPGNVVQDSLDDLWNAPELVSTREAMARGERPEGCAVCWKREAKGTISRRLHMNDVYKRGGGMLDVDALPREGADSGYRLKRRPDWFILELGNTCNLTCRSCSPAFSSRIAGDPVHSAWAPNGQGAQSAVAPPKNPRPVGATAWFRDVPATADMVASGATSKAFLSLIGGEPFIIKQTWQLLEALSQRGVAPNIYVGLLTNGQWRNAKLAELAPRFRGISVSVSIDGHEALYEYLRHGASWEKLLDTLDWLTAIDGVGVAATPTLQNANALYMVPLRRRRSSARLRAVVFSHAAGLVGIPSRGQRSSARSNASCAHSSAKSQFPVTRIKYATTEPQSERNASATAA
jgi:MoaA/NifB/PqqE/SkfB family radical SAM enzyme